jgi:hypothetical protein
LSKAPLANRLAYARRPPVNVTGSAVETSRPSFAVLPAPPLLNVPSASPARRPQARSPGSDNPRFAKTLSPPISLISSAMILYSYAHLFLSDLSATQRDALPPFPQVAKPLSQLLSIEVSCALSNHLSVSPLK